MTAKLTDYTSYADALRHCSKDALWELFDGDKGNFNIGHECLDRHPRDDIAVHVVRAEGGHDSYTFGELSEGSNRFANLLTTHGVKPGDCVAVMLDPCYEFYVSMLAR